MDILLRWDDVREIPFLLSAYTSRVLIAKLIIYQDQLVFMTESEVFARTLLVVN